MPSVPPAVLWGVGLAFVSMVIYGSTLTAVSTIRGLGSGPGSMLAAAAGVPAGVVIVLLQLVFGGGVEPPTAWAFASFALAGFCSTYLGRWLVFKSVELIGPSASSGLQSTSPLVTAAFGWIFLGEVIGPAGFTGVGLGILGLIAMSIGINQSQAAKRPAPGKAAAQGGFATATLLVGIGSAAAYSGGHVFRASAVRQWNEPFLGALIGTLAGLAALAVASRRNLAAYAGEIRAHPAACRAFLVIGVLQFIAQALVIASMRFIPASVAALISMCTPLAVMPISYFALRNRERLRPMTVLGICITLSGITVVILYGAARA